MSLSVRLLQAGAITETATQDNPGFVISCKTNLRISDGVTPNGGVKSRRARSNCVFRSVEKSLLLRRRNLCPSATLVRVHDGALAEEYEVSSTMLVVVEVCLPHIRLTLVLHVRDTEHRIIAGRQLSQLQRCVYKTVQIAE